MKKIIIDFLEVLQFEKKYSDNTILNYKNDLDDFVHSCLFIVVGK